MKIKVAVAGANGRMGREIIRCIHEEPDIELVLPVDPTGVGLDAGEVAGVSALGTSIVAPDDLKDALGRSGAQVLVDFTSPKAVLKNAIVAAESGVNLVIGTTGLDKEAVEAIEKALLKNGASAVISPNMATGVNVFFRLARDAAKTLGHDYDVEIIEVHHRHKKDAPSGTALRAAGLVAEALDRDIERDGVFGRQGLVGERKDGEIGVHAVRAGDVVGDHTVLFAGAGERIEITHRAHSREAFAKGVIKAVRFIADKEGGKIYSTWDVLGIK